MPRLQVLNGKRQGKIFEVEPGSEHVIGHRRTAPISIDDPWVSWDHARLFTNQLDGTCWIEDLGSTNGTYVNCVRVKREQLRHEDIIFLGKTHVIYLAPVDEPGAEAGFFPPPVAAAPGSESGDLEILSASSGQDDPLDILGMPSSLGPFNEPSDVIPPLTALRDPFQSTGSQQTSGWEPGAGRRDKKKKDPWSDSSVDPFSSGPDFGSALDDSGEFPPRRPSEEAVVEAERARRAFAETNADQQNPFDAAANQSQKASLSLSSIQGDEPLPNMPAPSSQEISQLIGPGSYDDLDAILGDGRALTPDPAPVPDLSGSKEVPPSEMRTREVDTARIREALAQAGLESDLEPEVPAPAAPSPGRQASTQPAGRRPPPPPPPPPPAPAPRPAQAGGSGEAAFERARLEDEVRRLRGALQAASQRDPEAVRRAAEVLRDQELGRLARRVAELEGQVSSLHAELAARQAELDQVTEDMIEKEDALEALEAEVERQRRQTGRASSLPGRPVDVTPASGTRVPVPSQDELPHGLSSDELEDFSSLEF